mgnify:CR=1 FL=1
MSLTNQQKTALAVSFESGNKERQDTAKIVKIKDSFINKERDRYQSIRVKLEINLAKAYGAKLPQICVDRLLDRALLDGDVYSAVVSGQNTYLPQSHSEWQAYVKNAATSDLFANAAIINADYTWKNNVRQQALESLSRPVKLAMDRAGTLSEFLDEKVREAENERAGL